MSSLPSLLMGRCGANGDCGYQTCARYPGTWVAHPLAVPPKHPDHCDERGGRNGDPTPDFEPGDHTRSSQGAEQRQTAAHTERGSTCSNGKQRIVPAARTSAVCRQGFCLGHVVLAMFATTVSIDGNINPDPYSKVKEYCRRMRIGDLAAAAAIPTETVRYYEKRGLLAAPPRSANGYRTYDDAALNQLRFIRTAQAAGLTLAEIGSVIELRDDGTTPCGHVTALLADKIAEVRERRVQLAALEQELIRLVDRSATLNPADCRPDDICHVLSSDGSIDASANWGPPLR